MMMMVTFLLSKSTLTSYQFNITSGVFPVNKYFELSFDLEAMLYIALAIASISYMTSRLSGLKMQIFEYSICMLFPARDLNKDETK